jgi:hypothetical protein
MGMNAREIEEQLGQAPLTNTRNINIDVHIGAAPQRPYAVIEDHLAAITTGYKDAGALKSALGALPKAENQPAGTPDSNEVEEEDGALYRWVVSQEPRTYAVRDGEIQEDVIWEKRAVGLSLDAARAASDSGTPTDYFNGFTWLREGFKPERDFPTMAKAAQQASGSRKVVSAPAAPSDVARFKHEVNFASRSQAPLPVEPSKAPAEPRRSRKEGE